MVSDLDEQQSTPLHLAVENRSYDVAKLCLEKGADVNKTTDNYSTPLHLAAITGEIKLVQVRLYIGNCTCIWCPCDLSQHLCGCVEMIQRRIKYIHCSVP